MWLFPRRSRWFAWVAFCLTLGVVLWGVGQIRVVTSIGVNYVVAQKEITLQEKVLQFLVRHFAIKRLVGDITEAKVTDREKAVALQTWVVQKVLPWEKVQALPVIDDHPYSIIVRGYGTGEQRADLLAILCGYAGIPAALYRLRHADSGRSIVLAVVRLGDDFYLFDPARDNLFYAEEGRLATLADLRRNSVFVARARNQPAIHGIPYRDYFSGLHPVRQFQRYQRADLQRPFSRLFYEMSRLLGLSESPVLYY